MNRAGQARASPAGPREILFRVSAGIAVVAALFHAVTMLSPTVGALEYESTYPTWRHVVFIIIDAGLAWLLLRRPMWLVWAFAVLTLQILTATRWALGRFGRDNIGCRTRRTAATRA